MTNILQLKYLLLWKSRAPILQNVRVIYRTIILATIVVKKNLCNFGKRVPINIAWRLYFNAQCQSDNLVTNPLGKIFKFWQKSQGEMPECHEAEAKEET